MIKLSFNPFFESLTEKELIILAQKNCKYSNDAKNVLLKKYQPYISNLLKKYPYYLNEDLEILAYVGILKAIEQFNPNSEVLLITYAQFFVKKEIINYIKNDLEITKREVFELISDQSQYTNYSDYEITRSQNVYTSEKDYIESKFDNISTEKYISNFLSLFPSQYQTLVNLIFTHDYSASEAAAQLHISKSRVSQILKTIKEKGFNKLSFLNNN